VLRSRRFLDRPTLRDLGREVIVQRHAVTDMAEQYAQRGALLRPIRDGHDVSRHDQLRFLGSWCED
jgi:hypothetical protein